MRQRDERILRKLVEEIEFLERMTGNLSREEFLADEVIQRASSMCSINIGELAKQLSDDFYAEYPDNELHRAARTRDMYAHGYFSLSFERVYATAIEDYPRVRAWVLSILPDQDILGDE